MYDLVLDGNVPAIGAASWFECAHTPKPTGFATYASAINHTLMNFTTFPLHAGDCTKVK
jgi:hypothetical protein